MLYATVDELINDLLPESKSPKERDALERALEAASRSVEGLTKRPVGYFAAALAGVSARSFAGDNQNVLRIPAHVADSIDPLTGVDVFGHPVTNWVEIGGWLYQMGGFGIHSGVWVRGTLYTVRARWGFAAIPADVREATKMLAAHLWERQRGTLGQITPSGFVIERDAPPPVKMLLAPYRRKEFEVA